MALTKLDIANAVQGIAAVANGGTGRSSDNRGLFYVYSGANQDIASNVYVQVALNTEVFDLDSYFNTTNYRYIPQVAGYYYIECMIQYRPKAADDNVNLATHIYKNGNTNHSTGASPYLTGDGTTKPVGQMCMKVGAGKEVQTEISSIVHLDGDDDYVDLRGYIYNYTNASASDNEMMGHANNLTTYMLGYRVS